MRHIHFIAIGGAVMHQLAIALQSNDTRVTGSDDEINDPAKTNLSNAGILPPEIGWHPERINAQTAAVVLGMHARLDNPELQQAQQLGVPVFSFPEYVYKFSQDKQRVVVAGSHGKTTITSMIMHVLRTLNKQFDYLVGARVQGFTQSVQLSDAPLIVLEGDEYPASAVERRPKIHFYKPQISVLSGIAWDHINVFPTYENYLEQFEIYLKGMEAGAQLIYNEEDNEVVNLVQRHAGHLHTIPYKKPGYRYENGTAIVATPASDVALQLFGSHNLLNMEAAHVVCRTLGVSDEEFYAAISTFTGAARRLEKAFEKDDIIAFRDFAHAPSKLKATLDAVREAFPGHYLAALFELHTYSSLSKEFLSHYTDSMAAADEAIVYFSKHALELKKLPALDKQAVADGFGKGNITVIDEKTTLEAAAQKIMAKNERPICLLLMSSGTFDGISFNDM